MARAIRSDQCGVCSEIGAQRVEPRVLPCGHSFCRPCLSSDHIRIRHHRCPTCRTSFDGDVEELPESETESQQQMKSSSSDAVSTCRCCTDSGIEADLTREAVLYCGQCKRSFCDSHIQLHKQLLPDHHTVTIEDFMNSHPNQQTFCRKHESYLLIVGCHLCRGLFCNMCLIVDPNYCFKSTAQEKVHKFEVVEEIISQTRNSLRVSVEKLEEKSREYGEITTLASQLQSKVENQNTQAINRLEQAKQAMIQSITDKFEILESQLKRNKFMLSQEIDDYTVDIEKTKQQIDKTIENLKQHADGCSEEELIMQIDDITVMVDEMLSWRQKNINCSQILTFQSDDQCPIRLVHTSLLSEPVSLQSTNSTLLEPEEEAESSAPVTPDTPSPPAAAAAAAPPPPPQLDLQKATLSDLAEARPPRPDAIVYMKKSSMLYDDFDPPQPTNYCSLDGALYLLCEKKLLSYAQPLQGDSRECHFDDRGEFIVAHKGIVYTKQPSGQHILRVYNVLNDTGDLVENLQHPFVRGYHGHLISSFVVSDEHVIFCKELWQPKLLVIPHDESNGPAREVTLMVEESKFKCRYITAGPQGHVLIMCDEGIGIYRPTYFERILLVKVSDGSVEWKYKSTRTSQFAHNFKMLPQPVIYRNGYCFFAYDMNTIRIIDVVTGQLLRSLQMSVCNETPVFRISIQSMQLIPYTDDRFLVVLNMTRKRYHADITLSTVKSELWGVEYES